MQKKHALRPAKHARAQHYITWKNMHSAPQTMHVPSIISPSHLVVCEGVQAVSVPALPQFRHLGRASLLVLAEGAIALSMTLCGGVLFAS